MPEKPNDSLGNPNLCVCCEDLADEFPIPTSNGSADHLKNSMAVQKDSDETQNAA